MSRGRDRSRGRTAGTGRVSASGRTPAWIRAKPCQVATRRCRVPGGIEKASLLSWSLLGDGKIPARTQSHMRQPAHLVFANSGQPSPISPKSRISFPLRPRPRPRPRQNPALHRPPAVERGAAGRRCQGKKGTSPKKFLTRERRGETGYLAQGLFPRLYGHAGGGKRGRVVWCAARWAWRGAFVWLRIMELERGRCWMLGAASGWGTETSLPMWLVVARSLHRPARRWQTQDKSIPEIGRGTP